MISEYDADTARFFGSFSWFHSINNPLLPIDSETDPPSLQLEQARIYSKNFAGNIGYITILGILLLVFYLANVMSKNP